MNEPAPTIDFASPALLADITGIASAAGAAIMQVRAKGATVREKSDRSPVTEADEAANAIILAGLQRVLPGIVAVSEESVVEGAAMAPLPDTFILVDPLDGTREFIDGRDEFTVNIAIVRNGRPVCGVVGAPALETIWRGAMSLGSESLRLPCGAQASQARDIRPLRTSPHAGGAWRAMVSRSHLDPATEAWLTRFASVEREDCGSSLKFCRIAEGRADVYPRLGRISEWDIAAGDAVLCAAGGAVRTPEGDPVLYGQVARALKVPSFVAWCSDADADRHTKV